MAKMSVSAWPFENTSSAFPPELTHHPGGEPLQVDRDISGMFHVRQAQLTASTQFYGHPMFWAVYRDFGVSIEATAEGYEMFVVSYYSKMPLTPDRLPPTSQIEFNPAGELVLKLKHVAGPNAIPLRE